MKGGPRVMVVDPTTGKPRASMDLPGPAQALHAIGDSAAAVAAGGAVLVAELGEDGSAMSAAEFPLPGTAVGPELEGHAWQLAGVANHPQRLLGLCGTAVVVWCVHAMGRFPLGQLGEDRRPDQWAMGNGQWAW
jgi:hypothetical protein